MVLKKCFECKEKVAFAYRLEGHWFCQKCARPKQKITQLSGFGNE
ncbi:MAG: hypothetical protein ABIA21_03290 [Candidatus Aenigmatarchaeota archaeon]